VSTRYCARVTRASDFTSGERDSRISPWQFSDGFFCARLTVRRAASGRPCVGNGPRHGRQAEEVAQESLGFDFEFVQVAFELHQGT
jgi:hypothetical protein